MSSLNELEADFLQRVVAARKERRFLVYRSDVAPHRGLGDSDEQTADSLLKRGLITIDYGHLQWNTVVAITDKGYEALAQHIADERTAPIERTRLTSPTDQTVKELIGLLRDQAKRIAELELRA